MPPTDNHTLILMLIREDLRCNKLITGLSELGLDADKYHPDICSAVLDLMGFKEHDDKLIDTYFNFMQKILEIPSIEMLKEIEAIALDLYVELVVERGLREDPSRSLFQAISFFIWACPFPTTYLSHGSGYPLQVLLCPLLRIGSAYIWNKFVIVYFQ